MRIWTWHGMAAALVCVFYLDSWGRVVLRDTRQGNGDWVGFKGEDGHGILQCGASVSDTWSWRI